MKIPPTLTGDNVYNCSPRGRPTARNTGQWSLSSVTHQMTETSRRTSEKILVPNYKEIEYDFTGTPPIVHTFTADRL